MLLAKCAECGASLTGYPVPKKGLHYYKCTTKGCRLNASDNQTPELPHLILHDPMGDKSFSFLQKDSSYSFTTQMAVAIGAEAGVYANLKMGAGFSIFGSPEIGGGFKMKTKLTGGAESTVGDEMVTTITASQQLSTADTDVFTGAQGDVFVGASYNIRYCPNDKTLS